MLYNASHIFIFIILADFLRLKSMEIDHSVGSRGFIHLSALWFILTFQMARNLIGMPKHSVSVVAESFETLELGMYCVSKNVFGKF